MLAVAVGDALLYCNTIGHSLHDFVSMGDCWICDALMIELGGVS